jgi:hypothetical protein
MIGEFCILRTRDAGVHCGTVKELAYTHSGAAAVVTDSRRVWRWSKAFSLNEMAMKGCGEDSRISEPVPKILLTEVIEVIPCSKKAIENLSRSRNGA